MAADHGDNSEIWVIDTSSVIEIKQVVPRSDWKGIYKDLSKMVDDNRLVYPKQIVAELENSSSKKNPDQPLIWAKANAATATRFGNVFSDLTTVMNHPIASRVCDPNKSVGPDEADPYVLALALHLKNKGYIVTVIAEESRSTPRKLALHQACGALKIYSMKVEVFLIQNSLFPRSAPAIVQVSRGPKIAKKRPL